jgi:ankyrin repeat protein
MVSIAVFAQLLTSEEEQEIERVAEERCSTELLQHIMDGLSHLALGELPQADKSRALIMASRRGLTHCILGLLEAGANPSAEDDYAYTPLMYVAAQGLDDCLRAMLRSSLCKVNKRTETQQTALHFAAGKGHESSVRILLEAGALVNAGDDWGETALMQAVSSGSAATVQLLLEAGARMDMRDLHNDDAMLRAAKHGHVAILRLLLQSGADPTRPHPAYETSPLHRAAMFGHTDCVSLLLDAGCDPKMRDHSGNTPVDQATQTDQWRVVQCLLAHGGGLSREELDTALAAAAFWDAAKSVQILLDHGASPNAVDAHGIPAFFLAIAQNNVAMAVNLVQHNCDVNRPVPQVYFLNTEFHEVCACVPGRYVRPLHMACVRGYGKLVHMLIQAGACVEPLVTLLARGLVARTITEDAALMAWLRGACRDRGPSSLRHLSRLVIRARATDTRDITKLPLPHLLQQYLLFDELNHL